MKNIIICTFILVILLLLVLAWVGIRDYRSHDHSYINIGAYETYRFERESIGQEHLWIDVTLTNDELHSLMFFIQRHGLPDFGSYPSKEKILKHFKQGNRGVIYRRGE